MAFSVHLLVMEIYLYSVFYSNYSKVRKINLVSIILIYKWPVLLLDIIYIFFRIWAINQP